LKDAAAMVHDGEIEAIKKYNKIWITAHFKYKELILVTTNHLPALFRQPKWLVIHNQPREMFLGQAQTLSKRRND